MPDIKNNIKVIYNALSKEGYNDLGSEQEFAESMADENNRKLVYNTLKGKEFADVKDYDSFSNMVYQQPRAGQQQEEEMKPVEPAKIDPRFVAPNVGKPTDAQPIMKSVQQDTGFSAPQDYNSQNAFLSNVDKDYNVASHIPDAQQPIKMYGADSNLGEVIDNLYTVYDEAYKKDNPKKIAEAANMARSMGLDNEQAEKALTLVHGLYSQNVANNIADYMYSRMNNGDPLYALKEVYYNKDFQKKLKDTTTRLGLDNTQGFVEYYLKPALQRKLENERGFTDTVNFGVQSGSDDVAKNTEVFEKRKAEEDLLQKQVDAMNAEGKRIEEKGQQMYDPNYKNRPWWADLIPVEGGGRSAYDEAEGIKRNPEAEELMRTGQAMQRMSDDAQAAISEDNILRTRKTDGLTNQIKNAFGRILRGGAKTATDIRTWDFGFTDLKDATVIKAAADAYASNRATAAQKALLNAVALKNAVMGKHGDALGGLYGAAGTTIQMAPYMMQFAASPVKGVGVGFQKYCRTQLEKAFGKYATEAVGKFVIKSGELAGRFVGDVAQGAAMTTIFNMPAVAADTHKRMTGDLEATTDSKGNIVYSGKRTNVKSGGRAFAEAFTAQTIENQSELVGEYFAPLQDFIQKGAIKALDKWGLSKTKDFLTGINNKQIMKSFNRFTKNTEWNGLFGEVGEEIVGNFENAFTVGDLNLNLDINDDNSVFSKKVNTDIILGVGLGCGIISGARVGSYIRNNRKLNTAINDADTHADVIFGTDRWQQIKSEIDNAPDDKAGNLLQSYINNSKLNNEQKQTIVDYTVNTYIKRGNDISHLKNAIEDNISSEQQEVQSAYENGQNARDAQMNEVKTSLDEAEKHAAELLGEDELNALDGVEDVDAFKESNAYKSYSEEQRETALKYIIARTAYNGMINRVQDEIKAAVNKANAEIDNLTHKDSGTIIRATLKNGDQEVYVVSGNVVTSPDEKSIDTEKSDSDIVVYNTENGKKEMLNIKDLQSVDTPIDAATYKADSAAETTQQIAEAEAAKIDGTRSFHYNDTVKVQDKEGNLIDGSVQDVTPDGIIVVSDAYPGGKTYTAAELTAMQPQPQTVAENATVEQQAEEAVADNESNEAPAEEKGEANSPQSEATPQEETAEPQQQAVEPQQQAIPTDDKGSLLYHEVPVERTIEDLYDGSLDDTEITDFISANIEAAQKEYNSVVKKAPKIGTDKARYLQEKKAYQEEVDKAKAKVDYWQAVENERQRITHTSPEELKNAEDELSGEAARKDYRGITAGDEENPTSVEDLVRDFLGGAKITPEDFRKETGLSISEQKKFVGMISKQGKTIARLGEELADYDEWNLGGRFFDGDSNAARGAIIDVLLSSRTRGDFKQQDATEEEERYIEAVEQQREQWYYENYHMTYEEYLQYREIVLPELLRKYANFAPDILYPQFVASFEDAYAAEHSQTNNTENNEQQRNDTTAEEPTTTPGDTVLQTEETNNSRGDSQSKEQPTEVPTSVRSSNENGTLPQSAPTKVDKEPQPIGNSFFGKVYNQFKGKAKEAVNFLMRHKSGKLLGVFHRNDIGEISLVWGDEKGGLAHIISKHIVEQNDFNNIDEVINTMQQVINNGTITRENKDKVVIDYNDYRVAIRKQTRDNNGNVVEQGNWIVTAFDKSRSKKDKTPSEKTLSTPPFNQETDGVTLPSNGVTADKVTQSSQTKETKEDKFSPTPRKDGESITDYAERVAEEHQAQRTRKEEEAKVDTNPTDAQKEAGNYKKGHIKVDGLDITIEQPKGSIRRGTDANGKQWESEMHNTYGYIRGTEGVDGDHIDVYLSDNPTAGNVFVVDQINKDGSFDEHKVMYGFSDMESARQAYLSNYEEGWQGLGNITEVSKEDFKAWIDSSKRKTKPFAEYTSVKTQDDTQTKKPTEENAAPANTQTNENYAHNSEEIIRKDEDGDASNLLTDNHNEQEQSEKEAEDFARQDLKELEDFQKNTDTTGRTAIDEDRYDAEDLFAALKLDGKPSKLGVLTVVPDKITDPVIQIAVYDYSDEIDDKTNRGWQKWGDLADEYNKTVDKDDKAQERGDTATLGFRTVDAAVKFNDWLNTDGQTKHQTKKTKKESKDNNVFLSQKEYVEKELKSVLKQTRYKTLEEWESKDVGDYSEKYDDLLDTYEDYVRDLADDERLQAIYDSSSVKAQKEMREHLTDADLDYHEFINTSPKRIRIQERLTRKSKYAKGEFADGTIVSGEVIRWSPTSLTVNSRGTIYTIKANKVLQQSDKPMNADEHEYQRDASLQYSGETLTNDTEAKQKATEAVLAALSKAGIEVVRATDEQAQAMLANEIGAEKQVVYHGSRAKFKNFDHSHMGEGEGQQAYGWGSYVTEVESIGRTYATGNGKIKFRGFVLEAMHSLEVKEHFSGAERKVLNFLHKWIKRSNNVSTAIEKVKEWASNEYEKYSGRRNWSDQDYKDYFGAISKRDVREWRKEMEEKEENAQQMLSFIETLSVDDFSFTQRHLYTVDIPDDTGSNYLNWEQPMSDEQLDAIEEYLKENYRASRVKIFTDGIAKSNSSNAQEVDAFTRQGKNIYHLLEHTIGDDKSVSEMLGSLGYTGISYPAQYQSGGRADNARNYVIFNEKDLKITDHIQFMRTPQGTIYGWSVNGKIYLTEAGINPETPIHEYTHLWADAMMKQNKQGWNSIKSLLKDTPVWKEVIADPNYSNIKDNEDAVASEVLSRISGKKNAAKMEEEAQRAIDEAKGVFEKAEAATVFLNLKRALKQFWHWVGKNVFGIKDFKNIDEVTDRVLYDLLSNTKLNSGTVTTVDGVSLPSRINVVEAEANHGFKNFDDGRKWAKENIARTYDNEETNGKGNIRISNTAIDKFMSEKAVAKSESKDVHMAVLKVLPDIIRESVDAEQHEDRIKDENGIRKAGNTVNPDVMIHRLYGAVDIAGKIYRVKVTLKENVRTKETSKAYSYEATKIELLSGQSGDVTMTSPRNDNNSILTAKLLKDIEKSYGKGVKLLKDDKSSDPRFQIVGNSLSDEEKKIVETAKANDTYMKAPNGKPTNLSEKQWAQVRTKAFKNWFGDWEKAARIEKLRRSKAVKITGEEIEPNSDLKQYKKNALEYGKNLRGEYTNKDTGETIALTGGNSRGGMREILQHDYKDIEHLQSIAAIPQIIEKAIFVDEAPNEDAERYPGVKSFRYYVCGLKIGNTYYTVKAVVAVQNNGDRYYDHKLSSIEKGKLLSIIPTIQKAGIENNLPPSVGKDKRLLSILQTNSSKVVDENGEPMVVYHGSNNEFTKFDTARIGSSTGTSDGRGFYFTTDKDYANSFGKDGNVLSVFLNIDNPLSLKEKTITKRQLFDIIKRIDEKEVAADGEHWLISNYANYYDVGIDGAIREAAESEYPYSDNDVELVNSLISASGNFKDVVSSVYEVTGKSSEIVPKENGTVHYVVTNPNQIKSATSNNGNFSTTEDDILYRTVFGGNSGYVGYSMSKRAAEAKEEGRYPKTEFRREYHITAKSLDMLTSLGFIDNSEWHHTSMYGNKTPFYGWAEDELADDYLKHKKEIDTLCKGIDPKTKQPLIEKVEKPQYEYKFELPQYNEAATAANPIIEWRHKQIEKYDQFTGFKGYADATEEEKKERDAYLHSLNEQMEEKIREMLAKDYPDYLAAKNALDAYNNYEEDLRKAIGEHIKEYLDIDKYSQRWREQTATTQPTTNTEELTNHAESVVQNLHLNNVEIVPDGSSLNGEQATAKGFYNKRTGKIVVVAGNHTDIADIEKTVLHEAVAHHGLRELFGDNFDNFLDTVFAKADIEIRRQIAHLSAKHGWNIRTATEEYLASMAEDTNFEQIKPTLWQRIKQLFGEIMSAFGLHHANITDNDLRYILWRSYKNLQNSGKHSILDKAEDIAMQYRLKAGNYADKATDNVLYRSSINPTATEVLPDARTRYEKETKEPDNIGSVPKTHNFFRRFYKSYVDSMLALKSFTNSVLEATGDKMASHEDTYKAENAMTSKNKTDGEVYNRDYYNPLLTAAQQLCEAVGMDYDALNMYMVAKHGLERNEYMGKRAAQNDENVLKAKKALEDALVAYNEDPTSKNEAAIQKAQEKYTNVYNKALEVHTNKDYSGLTELTDKEDVAEAEYEAQKIVDAVETPDAMPKVTAFWSKVNAATKQTLKTGYESGIMTKDTYEHILNMYKYYIPLRGWAKPTADDVYTYYNNRSYEGKPLTKTAKGRTSLAEDPMAIIASMAQHSIIEANRNKMKQTFLNFVLNHPTSLATVGEQWYIKNALGEWERSDANIPANATPDEISKLVAEHELEMQRLAEQGTAIKQRNGLKLDKRVINGEGEEHTIKVWRGGKEYIIYINGNPAVAQAVNGLTNPDTQGSKLPKWAEIGAAQLKNFLSGVYTSFSPAFVLTNFTRDQLFASQAVYIKYGLKYKRQASKNARNLFFSGALPRLVYKWEHGTLDLNNETERYFDEFMRGGGETGFTALRDIESIKKEVKDAINGNKANIAKRGWKSFINAVEFANRSAEDFSRFVTFMTSRQQGKNIVDSIYDAKDITVNFNKKGSGEMGSRFMNFAYIFFNAAVQSINNFGTMLKQHPARTMLIISKFGALGFGVPMLNAFLTALCGGGDDDKYWDNMDWVRRNNIVLRIPFLEKTFISIPLPQELRPFYGMGEIAASILFGKETFSSGLQKAVEGFTGLLPIDFTGNGGNLSITLTPTVLQPVAQYMFNTDYFGRKVYNDNEKEKFAPGWTKAFSSTPPALIGATKFLNSLTGGNDVDRGAVSLNPDVINHFVKGYFGGPATFVTQMSSLLYKGFSGDAKEIRWRDIPVASRFVQQLDERSVRSSAQGSYKDFKEETEETEYRLSNYKKQVKMGKIEYAKMITDLIKSPEYQRYKIAKAYKKPMDLLKEALNHIDNTTDKKEVEKALTGLRHYMMETVESEQKGKHAKREEDFNYLGDNLSELNNNLKSSLRSLKRNEEQRLDGEEDDGIEELISEDKETTMRIIREMNKLFKKK